jgi:hypothetical protein
MVLLPQSLGIKFVVSLKIRRDDLDLGMMVYALKNYTSDAVLACRIDRLGVRSKARGMLGHVVEAWRP